MPDFNVRSDSVNVEQIMEQIRARIREKRGADYTEEDIRQLATVKLEKFLDPRGVRSDLLDQFRRAQPAYQPPELPNYAFEEGTLFESTRGPLRWIRRLLLPILKLFFNPNPLIQALNIQSRLNTIYAERDARREAAAHSIDQLHYEVLHNLVIEMTRTGIEMKNLKMRLESLASRLEFNERRARALESVVVYKPAPEDRYEPPVRREVRSEELPSRESVTPLRDSGAAAAAPATEGPGQRSKRRRRRRGRRGTGSAASLMGGASPDAGGERPSVDDESADEIEAPGTPADEDASSARDVDHRLTRPEPFEQTFGAETHPAEPTVADPAPDPAPSSGDGDTDDSQ